MTPRVLVAGVGNVFLGDDGFGCEVVRRLLQGGVPPDVHVEDFGIRGFDLASALAGGADTAILIDATPRGDAAGTLYVIEPDAEAEIATDPGQPVVDTHGMDPVRVLRLAQVLGGRPRRLVVVGVEPASVQLDDDGAMELSDPVAAVVDEAVAIVRRLLAGLAPDVAPVVDEKEGDLDGPAEQGRPGRGDSPGAGDRDGAAAVVGGALRHMDARSVPAGDPAVPADEADVIGAGAVDA